MKIPLLFRASILVALFLMSGFSSCKKETENVAIANALVGLWNLKDASIKVTVDGVDFVDYAVSNFGISEDDAKAIEDEIIDETVGDATGDIDLFGNRTYQLKLNGQEDEYGQWTVSLDGTILTLFNENEENNLTILELTNTSLELKFPTESVKVDIDGDGVKETTADVDMKLSLTKQVGGAGS